MRCCVVCVCVLVVIVFVLFVFKCVCAVCLRVIVWGCLWLFGGCLCVFVCVCALLSFSKAGLCGFCLWLTVRFMCGWFVCSVFVWFVFVSSLFKICLCVL